MQEVEVLELKGLITNLEQIAKNMPERRRQLHEELGVLLKQEVDKAIQMSGINDKNNHLRDMQESVVGSRGGYAAVRAVGGKVGGVGANSAGAITNYLENGHKIRPPKNGKGYRPRFNMLKVPGRHFYKLADIHLQGKIMQVVADFAEKIAQEVECAK